MAAPLPERALRLSLVAAVKRLDALGLNRGSTGNASVRGSRRRASGFWITPSGMGASELSADDLVWVAEDGRELGAWQASSESPFHRAIYAARADLNAVVHLHSVHATALACLRRELPAFHYMVAVAGGDDVPCTPYHLFGSDALSRAVAQAFAQRHACLMANHGLVAGGTSLAHAVKVACEIESLCETYLEALAVGAPAILTREQMAEVIERFKTYGKTRRPTSPANPRRPCRSPSRRRRRTCWASERTPA
ncbi:MAG: class II aldolase/adducin family protein [Burkholderiaceae bacterium]